MVTEVPARAGRRQWLGLGLLALPLFVLAIDASVLFLAAPHIAADLGPTPTQWLWAMDVYGFMIAGLLVTMGSVGDRVGRRRLLLIGSTAFAVTSLWAASAHSPLSLIAARALLGAAGATLMPSTLALIRTMFRDERQRTTAVAVWMTTFSVGVALGPLIGGTLLEAFWWGSVFVVAVPVMAVVVLLGPLLLPESRDPSPARIDAVSVLLSIAAVLSLVYGLKELVDSGPDTLDVTALLSGLVLGTTLIRRQRTLTTPLIDPALFRSRAFRAALALLVVGVFTVTSANFLIPQFLQSAAGLSPLRAGLLTAPIALSAIAGSLTAPGLSARWGASTVIVGGAALSLVGYLVLAQVGPGDPLWVLVAGGTLAVLGLSPTTVLTTDLVVASAPEERAGSAAALSETSGELGVALGIAVMGSLATAVYRLRLPDLLPEGLSDDTLAAAREGVDAARETAGALPPEVAGQVATAASAAFGTAFATVGYTCGAITVALAVIALTGLRQKGAEGAAPRPRPSGGESET
ncbi:MFS transporter [Nocardiopsis sp. FIRDI 009]|uniref:MFS transporter n=1 Tax=Nocardiopsis sp. FIRDI 009 TaxID=714197 RepID=UPI000E2807B9|nr:MFS transporter [Nocardiopsis sp. FIRDI 009]